MSHNKKEFGYSILKPFFKVWEMMKIWFNPGHNSIKPVISVVNSEPILQNISVNHYRTRNGIIIKGKLPEYFRRAVEKE